MSNGRDGFETLSEFADIHTNQYSTILIDPPWRFNNRTGKMAPEHKRLKRYDTMSVEDLIKLPVSRLVKEKSHLYLWCPNALLADGLNVGQL